MATFANTLKPTPFGLFDSDVHFQTEADNMVTFVKRKMGDDILSVELTKKQVWACFEEASCEYSAMINQHQAQSQLGNLLGIATGSLVSGSVSANSTFSSNVGPHGKQQMFPRENLEFMLRRAEPYAMDAGLGGSYDFLSGAIELKKDIQDYDIYKDLVDDASVPIFSSSMNSPRTKLKIMEVFHVEPQASYRFFDTVSAINYLNNEFSFESFTPETVFYVLPVFEDILRAGQMDISNRVRRSNYSYKITGTKLRIFPRPTAEDPKKLWIRVGFNPDPFNPSYQDDTVYGVSNISNVPFGDLIYARVNSIGRQWIRQYTLGCCKELLGLVRSKFSSVPIPNGDLTLNGSDLIAQGREEKTNLITQLKEMLLEMTYSKVLESEAMATESLTRILKAIPIPNGRAIIMG
jgi:hypothetical protein